MRSGLVILIAIVSLCAPAFAYDWSTNPGNGSPENPYQISTPEQLMSIDSDSALLKKHYVLMNDIDFDPGLPGNKVFDRSIIGQMAEYSMETQPFEGVFDGNNHTLRNLYFVCQSMYYVYGGAFNEIAASAVVRNLNIENMNFLAEDVMRLGCITGSNKGTIRNCSVELYARILSDGYQIGGLVGFNTGTILNCQSVCEIDGSVACAGGCVGENEGTISHCSSLADICGFGDACDVGGFVGRNEGLVTQCFSIGDVEGISAVGGFVGSNISHIESCYSKGTASGTYELGGFAGYSGLEDKGSTISSSYSVCRVTSFENPSLTNVGGFTGSNSGTLYLCYWDLAAAGITSSTGGIGKTAAELKSPATFIGWGFDNAWTLAEGTDYPRLAWEHAAGTPITDEPRTYGGGDGTPADPYRILTPQHLASLGLYRGDFDKHFILDGDIEFPADQNGLQNFCVIGTPLNPFIGTFDGRGHSVSNLCYQRGADEFAALFGCVETRDEHASKITSVKLLSPLIQGRISAGTLIGCLVNAEIRDCGVENATVTAEREAGGLVARSIGGSIFTSYACADVSSLPLDVYVYCRGFGGLLGFNKNGVIDSCYAKGHVACDASIYEGDQHDLAGGLVGQNKLGSVLTSFAAVDNLAQSGFMQGLIGGGTPGSCFLSYWDSTISQLTDGPDGMPKTTAELMSPAAFIGWGDNVWTLQAGHDYPRLAWENAAGNPVIDQPRAYGGGSGTPQDPYRIGTFQHLETLSLFRRDFDKAFILVDHISMFKGPLWEPQSNYPIGNRAAPFTGSFDGNGFVLSNFTFIGQGDYIGLFGYVSSRSPAAIKNLTIKYTCISVYDQGEYTGALAGYIENTEVINCFVDSAQIFGNNCTGGLAGCASGSIRNCDVYDAAINGGQSVGGLVGWLKSGQITNCAAAANIGGCSMAGGLMGRAGRGGIIMEYLGDGQTTTKYVMPQNQTHDIRISKCSATATVHADVATGGFIGSHSDGSIDQCTANGTVYCEFYENGGFAGALFKGSIQNSYVKAAIEGGYQLGGFCGILDDGRISHCFAAGTLNLSYGGKRDAFISEINAKSSVESCFYSQTLGSSRLIGCTQLSEPQMKQRFRFTNWDFLGESTNGQNEIWRMCADDVDYPRLSWEFAQTGDFACGDGVDLADLLALADQWLTTQTAAPATFNYACDANADEKINLEDLNTLSQFWP